MAEINHATKLRVNRSDLARFISDHKTIVAFEKLFLDLNAIIDNCCVADTDLGPIKEAIKAMQVEIDELKDKESSLDEAVDALQQEVLTNTTNIQQLFALVPP